MKKLGPLEDLMKMIPGFSKNKQLKNLQVDEKELVRVEAIINSMTPKERRQHSIINGSRRRRIAKGSGTTVQDVNRLLKNYSQALKMLKKMNKSGMRGLGNMMPPM
jgi:signal recognition particle subunit SRP54